MKNKTIILFFGIILLFTIIFTLNVNSSGVSSPYWDDNPMYAQAGEIKEFSYTLQNMVGNEDIKMQATLEGDASVIQFVNKNSIYNVPFGSNDIKVPVRVTVPSNAKEGDEYQVGVRFTTISDNTGKPVVIGAAFSKGFKVIVGKPKTVAENANINVTKPLLSNQLTGFLVSLVVLVILALVIRYFNKRKEHK
jgi:hypothetical protein